MRQKIAIIGSGISGLGAAYLLSDHHDVTVFEADGRLGGHSNTVDVTVDGQTFGVDTGFLVFNERTYPKLCRLFGHLQVPVVQSEMSFSVQIGKPDLEWAGTDLSTVFAQRRNLLSPTFWSMLLDALRFNRAATKDLDNPAMAGLSLGDYLDQEGYGESFRTNYLLPMAAAIWSCPTAQMLAYPFHTFVRFCHNHGLLQITDRPTWVTVAGGSRTYVRMLADALSARGSHVKSHCGELSIARDSEGVSIRTVQGDLRF
ncbi:MAG: NAD(P)-binding protein, partial [Rhodocyclaceae bacterium]|nr:NAD(P)-binding protein [Rhodocyclaceae bacterium]